MGLIEWVVYSQNGRIVGTVLARNRRQARRQAWLRYDCWEVYPR